MLAAVLLSPDPLSAATMSAGQAAHTLGDMREGYRQNAIAALARGGQLASPLEEVKKEPERQQPTGNIPS